jgi:formyltetrahydrofolate deformylase
MTNNLVLRFRAADRPGIVAATTTALCACGCNVQSAAVFGDADTGSFFCRMEISSPISLEALVNVLRPIATELALDWEIKDLSRKMRVVIAVSKFGHCLIDLIHKKEVGQLPVEIVGVVSNHEEMRKVSEWHGLSYHHLPMSNDKKEQEVRFLEIIEESGAELTVLARYMQILSDDFCTSLGGRCINIHHSFLPSFKGAKPYHQAHARGVKIIGATAHFVTADLDEGPIIEQDVRRVNHGTTAEEMVAIGRETEASVLSRAVRWHAEHRIFLNGNKTAVL